MTPSYEWHISLLDLLNPVLMLILYYVAGYQVWHPEYNRKQYQYVFASCQHWFIIGKWHIGAKPFLKPCLRFFTRNQHLCFTPRICRWIWINYVSNSNSLSRSVRILVPLNQCEKSNILRIDTLLDCRGNIPLFPWNCKNNTP